MPRPKLPVKEQKARFCISIPRPLCDRLDALFTNRSAVIQQAIVLYLDRDGLAARLKVAEEALKMIAEQVTCDCGCDDTAREALRRGREGKP